MRPFSIAKAFIASDGNSDKARDAAMSEPEFSDLMSAYNTDSSCYKALVEQLQQ